MDLSLPMAVTKGGSAPNRGEKFRWKTNSASWKKTANTRNHSDLKSTSNRTQFCKKWKPFFSADQPLNNGNLSIWDGLAAKMCA